MYYIGIDLGGTNIAAGIVNDDFTILKKASTPTMATREPSAILDDMAKLCYDLLDEAGLKVEDIEYAGIATPGTANHDTGIVVYANNLPFLNYPLAEELKARIPFKAVYIENDANAAAKGEAVAGAAKGTSNSVMITLGTGVGGGVIIDNKILSKSEIISYLDFFINQRSSLWNMTNAISKWEADREFVENYKIGQFMQHGVKAIYRN